MQLARTRDKPAPGEAQYTGGSTPGEKSRTPAPIDDQPPSEPDAHRVTLSVKIVWGCWWAWNFDLEGESGDHRGMSTSVPQVPDPEVPAKPMSRSYTAAYKSRILAEYDGLGKAAKGALLRREANGGIWSGNRGPNHSTNWHLALGTWSAKNDALNCSASLKELVPRALCQMLLAKC